MLGKGVGGKMWRVVKNLYGEVGSCVRLGEEKTVVFVRGRAQARVFVVANSFLNFHRRISRDREENRRALRCYRGC